MEKPKITIMIPTSGRRDFLERCLSCIYETSEDDEREIIVWDNASEDDTPNFLGSLIGYPGIRAIRSEENFGSKAFICMLKLVETRYAMTMDDDAWIVSMGWAKDIIEKMEQDPDLCAVGFNQVSDERQIFGISGTGYKHDQLSRPGFRTSTLVGKFRGRREEEEFLLNPSLGEWVPLSQNSTVWRADYIRTRPQLQSHGDMEDWGNIWHPMHAGKNWGITLKHLVYHACGPWWHLGQYEAYWDKKSSVDRTPLTKEKQMNWLAQAKEWSGWGESIEKATEIKELR